MGSHLFPCGRCEPCRINRKRTWTNRLLLEAGNHGDNSFWTLTYREECLPRSMNGLSTLAPEDAQKFMKRIRKAHVGMQDALGIGRKDQKRLRFYLVGEYGDGTERPHYHLALFGYPCCSNGQTLTHRGRPLADKCCSHCHRIWKAWALGDVHGGELAEGSAKYLVGYVLKKMTRFDDQRLNGRMPEFARMSLRPGIGADAMWEIADVLMQLGLDESEADVPSALRRGSTIAPLGRYLRQRLRLMIGKEVTVPDEALREAALRLLPMRLAAKESSTTPSFKAHVVEAFRQDVLNREKRNAIFKQRKSI